MSPRSRMVGTSSQDNSLNEPLLAEEEEEEQTSTSQENGDAFLPQQEQQPTTNATSSERISRNVPIALTYTAFNFAGRSVWSQSVLSTFVFLLRQKDYRAVGLITAVMGLAQLLTSFPSGILADRYRRDTMLRIASVVALGAIGATLYAVYTEDYRALVVGLAIWGCYYGISNTAMSAIFADSIPTGQRSKYFTHRSLLVNLGFAVGPIVSLILFAALGDNWDIQDCAIVLAVGQAICLPAIALLCFLSDDHVVSHEEEHDERDNGDDDDDDGVTSLTRDVSNNEDADDLNGEGRVISTGRPAESNRESGNNDAAYSSCARRVFGFLHRRRIAVFIATADLISGLASGMSIRYFPIFFFERLKMGPVKVQIVYALSPMFIASCFKLAQSLSTRFGRCRVAAAFKWTGVALMWILVIAYKLNLPRWWVCAIYIIRTAFINSTGALTRSVLMDHVPPSERGRWAALESLNMFSWSGSAALGGYLVGMIDMAPLFCMTAGVQFIATFPLVLLSLDEKLEGHASAPGSGERRATTNNITQPLLSNGDTQQRRRGSV